jgi:hypothetical protein
MYNRSNIVRRGLLVLAVILVTSGAASVSAQECSVTIDNISGAWNDGGTLKLMSGMVAKFNFRLNVSCDSGFGFNISNAFVISSPDGGDWGYAQGAPYRLVWGDIDCLTGFRFTTQFFNHFDKTGGTGAWGIPHAIGAGNVSGTDSVGVLFAGASAKGKRHYGMPGGFNGIPYYIEMMPTVSSEGKHICIDTVYVPGGVWRWPCNTITHPSITPNWYPEPQCFEIVNCCFREGMGNIDLSPDRLVTMADLTILIDHLFIDLTPLMCPVAANLDQSLDGLVTMDDLTVLIDHLYITLAPLPACP